MTVEELLADAQQRKAQIEAAHLDLSQQMIALNTKGIELEKQLLGIGGEIKALMDVGAIDG